jgi:hypothetical protein
MRTASFMITGVTLPVVMGLKSFPFTLSTTVGAVGYFLVTFTLLQNTGLYTFGTTTKGM